MNGTGGTATPGAVQRPAAAAVPVGGYRLHAVTGDALCDELLDAVESGRKRQVFFANTNFVVSCEEFAARFDDPVITLVNDGVGMDLAARMVHGRRFRENLNGTDFIPRLLRSSPLPLRVFLFGARPEVVREASRAVERRFGQQVVGACSGYGVDDATVCEAIRAAR